MCICKEKNLKKQLWVIRLWFVWEDKGCNCWKDDSHYVLLHQGWKKYISDQSHSLWLNVVHDRALSKFLSNIFNINICLKASKPPFLITQTVDTLDLVTDSDFSAFIFVSIYAQDGQRPTQRLIYLNRRLKFHVATLQTCPHQCQKCIDFSLSMIMRNQKCSLPE